MEKNIRLTIGEFSRYCGVTVKTLRHYERMGLLVPNEVDEWTRYRYYDVAQMQQLNGILRLKEMGFSLEEVRDLLDEGTHKPSVKQLEEKIKQVEQLLKNLQDRLILLRRMADSQAKIDTAGRIFVQRLPEIVVASHRQVLAKRSDLTALCAHVLGPEIQRIGCKRSLPIYSFVIEHDEEYKTTDVDTEYCEQVEEMMPDTRLIQFKRLPEIPMAVCMKCYGSYQHWYEQKAELFDYIEKQGYQICGRHRRQYVEGAWNQKDPEKWLTIIQVPVTKEEHKINVPNETFYQ
jgi:DNA-binding transcriptional MerR regulator